MRMKRSLSFEFTLLILICAVSLLIGPLSGTSSAKTYRFKIQSAFPRGDASADTLAKFAEAAEKRSNGQVKIKVFAAPEIVPWDQVIPSCKRGVIDMVQGAGVVWGEIIPVAYAEFGLPGTFVVEGEDDFEKQAVAIRNLFHDKGLVDILREEYAKQDLYFLDIHAIGPVPVTVSKVNPKTCDDLKGLVCRADGLNMIYQTAVGMKTISVPGEEAYLSFKTGVLDAGEWDISAITGLKWYEVAPYWLRGMENDQAIQSISVNMKKWKSLPDDIKEAIKGAAEDYFWATLKVYKGEVEKAYQLEKEGKLTIVELNQECKDKYNAMAKKILKEDIGDDPATLKFVKIIKKWRGWE